MLKLKIDIVRLFIACSILMMVSCNEKKQFNGYLYPIRENGLYGYIDSVGNRIIKPEFLWVSTFHNGLAMAVVDTIYRVVPDSMAYEVGEGDSLVSLYRMFAKYGYIDKTGTFVIAPDFVCYGTMPEIGVTAKDMDDCSNTFSRFSFYDKRALFCDTTTWKNGYIDPDGKVIIEPKYYYSEPFNEGLAVVRDAVAEPLFTNGVCITPSKLRCAYIDTLGQTVTEFKYETLRPICSGRGIGTLKNIEKELVSIDDTTFIDESYTQPRFLINNNGKEIKELDFTYFYYGYSNDGISVALNDFLWKIRGEESYCFIGKNGEQIEPLDKLSKYQLDSIGRSNDILQVLPRNAMIRKASSFSEGYAGISPDGDRWFVVDKYLIIHGYGEESIFEKFRPFKNGLAAVKRNGKWGFINKRIKEQIPCKYDSCGIAYPYLEEIFEYDIQGAIKKKAYINRNDSLIWESTAYNSEIIENNYSTKNKKEWGKWIYQYSPISYLTYWCIASIVILFFIIILLIVRYFIKRCKGKLLKGGRKIDQEKNVESVSELEDPTNNPEVFRSFPSIGKYVEIMKQAAITPDDYFNKLSHLHPVLNTDGDPIMSVGNFAVVFKMVDNDGKFYAVRCFHRYQPNREKSYKLICKELSKVSSMYLLPINYLEKELFIDENEYPVLLMDWVDGMTLDKYLQTVINDYKTLGTLAENFRLMAIWLLSQPFAHGDLKPDNIIVKNDGSLVLVDYDGMFVPAMQGQKAREIGSPDFRNPLRTEMDFDRNIDNFPIVSILLSLELIATNSEYLERFGKEDRLLFSYDDYLNLRESGIFKRALVSYAGDIPNLAEMLERMANGEPCNKDSIKNLLLKNNLYDRLRLNDEIERKSSWFVGGCFILVLFLPLYLRAIIGWHIVMLYVTILFLVFLMFLVLVFVDRSRPNKKEHINTIGNEGPAGFFWWINFIPLLLMSDSFTNWFNSYIPFLSQPFYKSEWYVTALMWVVWWYSGMAIVSIPEYLLGWRLKHFKTQEEAVTEQIEKELSTIKAEIKKEDTQWKEDKKGYSNENIDDLPF